MVTGTAVIRFMTGDTGLIFISLPFESVEQRVSNVTLFEDSILPYPTSIRVYTSGSNTVFSTIETVNASSISNIIFNRAQGGMQVRFSYITDIYNN